MSSVRRDLPLTADVHGTPPEPTDGPLHDACAVVDGCLTCGDVAVPVTVVEVDGREALCRDPRGNVGAVAIDLVSTVRPGDRLLTHAGVAIERLTSRQRA